MKLILKILVFPFFIIACSGEKRPPVYNEKIIIDTAQINELINNGTAKRLVETNCYTCHNPNAESHDNMLAPPLVGMKYRYKQAYPQKEEFVYFMSHFILSPSKENALMRGPVRRFGLMPPSVLNKEEIQAVVSYIYDNKIAEPEWFSKHFEEEQGHKWVE